ncbi:TetR/AcrR family transcriptional regulator [Pseudalkalibacillus decolorationis]|uniref:TetR/AcrR family transcriptional regulator n=1 Tax=Pseudalkalibacillus decolorationis TaxID=163879 RepID=UPI0021479A35|nr:TetR/AcrR family transcriptional regulator [Pseudalkalibacillus decolorationis]
MEKTTSARTRLIEATFNLIEQQGYHGTGLNQIIKESGAPKGSLYYYFPDGKEQLVSEAIELYGQALAERIRGVLKNADNPAEIIKLIFTNFAKKLDASGCTKSGSFATIVLETSNTSERLRKACNRMYDSCSASYTEMFMTHGFSEKRATQIATLITTSMEGAIILCRAKQSSEPLIQIAEELKSYINHAKSEMSN